MEKSSQLVNVILNIICLKMVFETRSLFRMLPYTTKISLQNGNVLRTSIKTREKCIALRYSKASKCVIMLLANLNI